MRSDDTHAPTRASSVEILLHELCARLILQKLHVLLELELSDLFLSAKWVLFPCDFVQFQLMLHAIELLLKFELVQLLLRLVQLLQAWLCCETGATGVLLPQLIKLPLRLIEFEGTIEIITLFALGEFVDLLLLGRWYPLMSERVGCRPVRGRSQKKCGQQKTCSNRPEQFHRRTSLSFRTLPITIS